MVAVTNKWIEYPVRLLPKVYRISVIYDYLLFPLTSFWYNQTTYSSKLKGIILQTLLIFSLPLTVLEYWIERKTNLVNYKTWTCFHTYTSLSLIFLFIRSFMSLIRRLAKDNQIPQDTD